MEISKENNSELPSTSSSFEETGKRARNKTKLDPTCCPVCSCTIRQSEIHSHYNSEIEKLNKIAASKMKLNGENIPSTSTNGKSDNNPDKHWETYQKIRSNRQNRQRTKTRKRRSEDINCPICNREITEEITLHVELCLRRSEGNGSNTDDDDESIDVENYEEYEWAGQKRIRTTTLLPGGTSSLGTTVIMADDDEDLNVDGDDAQLYGSPQYSERDIILPCGDAEDVALRKAVIGSDPKRLNSDGKSNAETETVHSNGDPVLEVLKNRIKELEAKIESKGEVYKCLICMERYRTPVISVCCWHVHCEQCWLQTLGAKKLCPQCNMITSPADLRRIYM